MLNTSKTSPSAIPHGTAPAQIETDSLQVTFIAGDFPPMLGGISQFMYALMRNVRSARINVAAIALKTPGWAEFDRDQDFPIHRISPVAGRPHHPKRMKFLTHQYVRELSMTAPTDFVVCNHGSLWLMTAAWINRRLHGTPYGVFLHGTDVLEARQRRSARFYEWLLRQANQVFPNSRITADAAVAAGVTPANLTIVHPCVNPEHFTPTVPPGTLRRQLGVRDEPLVLTVARLVPSKGIDVLIDAMPTVLQADPSVHYAIVGDGPSRSTLEAQVVRLELQERVFFLGSQTLAQMPNVYQDASVFALTPRELNSGSSEAFGLVYLEANLLELPVIAANVGGVRDAVVNGINGLLVPPEAPDAAAQAILTLLQNPADAANLGKQGRARAVAEFSCSTAAARFLDALTKSPNNNT
jgi:phosphatidylinositol alpha-1,6-mannosyltransferase